MSTRTKGREYELKAQKELEAEGWICWRPPAAKYQSQDIFDLYDLLCIKGNKLKFVQVKSGNAQGGFAAIRKRMTGFFKKEMAVTGELWEWKTLKSKTGWKKTIL